MAILHKYFVIELKKNLLKLILHMKLALVVNFIVAEKHDDSNCTSYRYYVCEYTMLAPARLVNPRPLHNN